MCSMIYKSLPLFCTDFLKMSGGVDFCYFLVIFFAKSTMMNVVVLLVLLTGGVG